MGWVGNMEKTKAEELLKDCEVGTYLTRRTQYSFFIVLSYKSSKKGFTDIFFEGSTDRLIESMKQQGIIKKPSVLDDDVHTPMSELSEKWIYPLPCEYQNYPYFVKRVYSTKELVSNTWPEWMTDKISRVNNIECFKLCFQVQFLGGKKSRFQQNKNKNSMSWRDTTLGFAIDIFYKDPILSPAVDKFFEELDQEVNGTKGVFSTEDRRVLWGSYGNKNMKEVYKYYHDEQTYKDLCTLKAKVDPKGVFSPNLFGVPPPEQSNL